MAIGALRPGAAVTDGLADEGLSRVIQTEDKGSVSGVGIPCKNVLKLLPGGNTYVSVTKCGHAELTTKEGGASQTTTVDNGAVLKEERIADLSDAPIPSLKYKINIPPTLEMSLQGKSCSEEVEERNVDGAEGGGAPEIIRKVRCVDAADRKGRRAVITNTVSVKHVDPRETRKVIRGPGGLVVGTVTTRTRKDPKDPAIEAVARGAARASEPWVEETVAETDLAADLKKPT